MWERQRDREIDPAWKDVIPYWHQAMMQFAEATIKMLGHG